jgi:hypothetical protein
MTGVVRRVLAAACAAAVAVGLVGCGGDNRVAAAKSVLRGRLTADKKPVSVGTVTAYKGGSKVAETQINPDGGFELYNLPPGDYQLTVTHTDVSTPYAKPLKLPSRYAEPAGSGLTVNVADGENKREFDLQTH